MIDHSPGTQKRILSRVVSFFDNGIGDMVSYTNYTFYNSNKSLCSIYRLKDRFLKKYKIKSHNLHGDRYSPFSYKGYDFVFEYDSGERESYFRYICDDDYDKYEDQEMYKSGILEEILEIFYDVDPNLLHSIEYVVQKV